ncbi:MAG: TolC family protein [Sphingobacteriaceae bacterium]|nr:MAG: TolC family protein [Sphingobacteriaceae bacterium]
MRFLKIQIITVLILSSATAYCQQADTLYNLQECLDIAIRNNLDVKRSELDMYRSRVYYNQARANLLPTLNGEVTHNFNNGRFFDDATGNYVNNSSKLAFYNLSSRMTVFNGLSLINAIRQTSLAYQAGKMDFLQAKNDISLNVITAYLQVQNTTDQMVQAETQVVVSKNQVDRLAVLNKDGNATPAEFYNLKGQLANDKVSLINAQNNLISAKIDLLQLMNVPFDSNIKFERLPAEQLPGSYQQKQDEIYNNSLRDFASVKAASLRVQSAEKGVSVAKGSLFPTLALFGNLATNYSSNINDPYSSQFKNNFGNSFGVGLTIPILNSFQNRNKVALAKIDLLEARYVDQTTKVQLKQNVDQAYTNMTTAYNRYQVLTEQVDAYAEAFRTIEIRFNAGALNSVDYTVAKGNLDRSRISLINARYEYFVRTKILDYYQSRLTL